MGVRRPYSDHAPCGRDRAPTTGRSVASSKTTSTLASAQRDAAAAAKVAASEQRATAMASREAADASSAAAKQVAAAKAGAGGRRRRRPVRGRCRWRPRRSLTPTGPRPPLSAAGDGTRPQGRRRRGTGGGESPAPRRRRRPRRRRSRARPPRPSKDALAKRDVAAAAREAAIAEAADAAATDEAAKKRSEAYTNTGKKAGASPVRCWPPASSRPRRRPMSFDKSLSGVQAVSQASAAEMGKLRTAALQAGADTAFTATQAADAEAELVKAGVSCRGHAQRRLEGRIEPRRCRPA
jgi:hypothetical protein